METTSSFIDAGFQGDTTPYLKQIEKDKAELPKIEKAISDLESVKQDIEKETDKEMKSVRNASWQSEFEYQVTRQQTLVYRIDKLEKKVANIQEEEKKRKQEEEDKKKAEEIKAKESKQIEQPKSIPEPPSDKWQAIQAGIGTLKQKELERLEADAKRELLNKEQQILQNEEKYRELELNIREGESLSLPNGKDFWQAIKELENLYYLEHTLKTEKLRALAMSKWGEILQQSKLSQEIFPIKVMKFRDNRARILQLGTELDLKIADLVSKYSTTSLVVEGMESNIRKFATWLEREKLIEIEEKKGKFIHIFVDNSNILVGSVHVADKSRGHVRVNIDKFADLLKNRALSLNLVADKMYVVGSVSPFPGAAKNSNSSIVSNNNNSFVGHHGKPRRNFRGNFLMSPNSSQILPSSEINNMESYIEKKWKKAGFSTKFQIRTQGEQFVDDALIAEINALLLQSFDQPQHIILCTGDGNKNYDNVTFPGAVETAIKNKNWTVEIWSWKDCINGEYKRLQNQYGKDKLSLVELDQFKDVLLEYKN